jgi:excisionase family DNA binding protein
MPDRSVPTTRGVGVAAAVAATLTVQQVADRYSVTAHTVLGWIACGELRAINVGRTRGAKKPRWRITPAALDAFEAARSTTPPAPVAPRRKQEEVIRFY